MSVESAPSLVLRQVAMVARDLEATVDLLNEVFGIEVAHRDPGIARFGLKNAVLAAGTQFLEVVCPVEPTAPALRYLGDEPEGRGYMVIMQCRCEERPRVRARARDRGIREIYAIEDADGYFCTQWHPRDIGGAMLEVDCQEGDDMAGPWWPAGGRSDDRGVGHIAGIRGCRVACPDPGGDADRWGRLLERDPEPVGGAWSVRLDGSTVEMIASTGERTGVVEAVVAVRDIEAVLSNAREQNVLAEPDLVAVSGMGLRVTTA
jgi:catechol 2,3-dioxygenase-like lactoylglutathione lyase family enzyme